jgi:hypothetical protein
MYVLFVGFLTYSSPLFSQNCEAPVEPSAANISNSSASLNWMLIDPENNEYASSWVRYKELGSSAWTHIFNAQGESQTIPNNDDALLTPNTSYVWQVRATCVSVGSSDVVNSAWSVLDTFSTTNLTVCDAPSNLSVSDITNFNANLNWVFENDVDQYISSWVRYKESGSSEWTHIFSALGNNQLIPANNDNLLIANTEYVWQVKSTCTGNFITDDSTSSWSVLDTFLTTNFTVCDAPLDLNASNVLNFTASLNWTYDNDIGQYVSSWLRYRGLDESEWTNIFSASGGSQNIPDYNDSFLSQSTTYIWQVKATCTGDFINNDSTSAWSVLDTFVTTNFSVDCNNTPNGFAFFDDCQNCVGGTTGQSECISFSPEVNVELSNTNCDSLSDLTINVSQDPNEPDMLTSLFSSNLGSFDIGSVNVGDIVGSADMMTAGGGMNFNTNLSVISATENTITVQSQEIGSDFILGSFLLTNLNPGISILANSMVDSNNVTSGNSSSVTFNDLFFNPGFSTSLNFTSVIESETGDQYIDEDDSFSIFLPL